MSRERLSLTLKPGIAGPAALAAGVAGAVGCIISFLRDRKDFFASYLTAFSFFTAIALGALFFVLVQHLARSAWSVTVRRLAEAVAANLKWMPLLCLPLLLGMHDLFHWTHPEVRATDLIIQNKAAYLNEPFFLARTALYLAAWWVLAWWFFRTSNRQDDTADASATVRMGKFAAPAIIVYALTQTFFAFDWIMSLDPHWFSTMFGLYFFAGSVVAQYCVLIILTTLVRRATGRKDIYNREHYHDMGKLLFGHNVFWTYIAFSQFMLIWYANIPEETIFFAHRSVGSWKTVSLLLPWCHFAVPFLYLMSWRVKRSVPAITAGAVWLLVMCFIDIYWLIQPNFHHHGAKFGFSDVSALVAVGGFLAYLLLQRLQKISLVPVGDPRLQDCLTYENGVVD